jgi:hypothetical protein
MMETGCANGFSERRIFLCWGVGIPVGVAAARVHLEVISPQENQTGSVLETPALRVMAADQGGALVVVVAHMPSIIAPFRELSGMSKLSDRAVTVFRSNDPIALFRTCA